VNENLISQVNVKPFIDREDNLLGVASVTFDNAFTIHGLRVMQGKNGPFVSMPSRKDQDGVYRDIFHPVTKEGREFLQQKVLGAYEKAKERAYDEVFREEPAAGAETASPTETETAATRQRSSRADKGLSR